MACRVKNPIPTQRLHPSDRDSPGYPAGAASSSPPHGVQAIGDVTRNLTQTKRRELSLSVPYRRAARLDARLDRRCHAFRRDPAARYHGLGCRAVVDVADVVRAAWKHCTAAYPHNARAHAMILSNDRSL